MKNELNISEHCGKAQEQKGILWMLFSGAGAKAPDTDIPAPLRSFAVHVPSEAETDRVTTFVE